MFFNSWIAFLSEAYLFLAVCAGLNIYYLRWNSYGETINSALSITIAVLLLIFPFYTILFYAQAKNYKLIEQRNSEFLERYGHILEGLNLKRRGK